MQCRSHGRCIVDYRPTRTWSVVGVLLDATWTRLTSATGGATEESLNNAREDATVDEGHSGTPNSLAGGWCRMRCSHCRRRTARS